MTTNAITFKDSSVHPRVLKEMPVVVKTLSGKAFTITCEPQETLLDFKLKIQNKEGPLPDQQRLIYAGKQLGPDTELLGELGIEDNCILHMVLRLRGGGCAFGVGFDFASMKNGRKVGFADNGPDYRIIRRGFNLEGRCTNEKCEAFQQLAWGNLGFSRSAEDITSKFETIGFNIGTEVNRTPCPLCKESFDPKSIVSCGFYLCQYTYEGYQQGSKSPIKGSGKASDKDGIEYHDGMADSKEWSSLIIVVEPL